MQSQEIGMERTWPIWNHVRHETKLSTWYSSYLSQV